jgi:mannitol/fructose-specific phosphotransferase system IIA component (Ntr-type)
VRFDERNDALVHFAFLLITPREDYDHYLVILSQLARLMHKESNRNALLKCITPKSASELIICSGNTMEPC